MRSGCVGHAVIVEEVVATVGAVRQRRDVRAHQRLGARAQRCKRGRDDLVAVFVEQGVQAAFAEIERVELPIEVAPIRLRHAGVRGQNVDDVLLQHAGAHELYRRNAEPLLEAFGRLGVEIARHVAADIEPVADRGEPGENPAGAHERSHQPDVVEMGAAVVWVVEEKCVAGREIAVACDFVDHRLDRERHGADEDRQAGRSLHQGRAGFGMIEAVAGVVRLGNDRIERRAIERRVHLVGDLDETTVEHRERDRIEQGHRRLPVFLPVGGAGVSYRLPECDHLRRAERDR